MAKNTDPNLQKQIIYSIYVRSHTEEGNFRAILPDLDRIRSLGADIIWFMPIHPIGVKGKKGSLGCPYANRDYRAVNPAYGTMEDFRELADAIHARGMKVMIDVVYNHASPDCVLYEQHPEFFWHDAAGRPGNKIGDWADVIDLDYRNPALWDYQIESLCGWAQIVDGFRCDVASFVPVAFWEKARAAVEKVHPGCIWLAETVHGGFGAEARHGGFYSATDYEMFSAFDLEYEYDIREYFDRYLRGEIELSHWLDMLNMQEATYPINYNKMRCLENHDQPRIASFVPEESDLINFTALLYFLKGTTLLYAGQEVGETHKPSLFEKEPVNWNTGKDLSPLLRRLAAIKHGSLSPDDSFHAASDDAHHIALLERDDGETRKIGVFSLHSQSAMVSVKAPDGTYVNQIDGGEVLVKNGQTYCAGKPAIFTYPH